MIMNKRDKEQLEYWKNIWMFMSASFQCEEDALNIDFDKEEAQKIRNERENWLLNNFQLIRPSKATQNRRNPINIFNIFTQKS